MSKSSKILQLMGKLGGGLPEGGAPNQQLVTDADGKTVWEDKPFYTETNWDELAEEQTVENAQDGAGLESFSGYSRWPQETDIIKVEFDGSGYIIEDREADGSVSLYLGDRTFGKTPFYLHCQGSYTNQWTLNIYCQDAAPHTVKVSVQNGVNVVKIPAEYIPEMSASAFKLYLKYAEPRFYLDDAYTTVATKERIVEAYSKGANILIYNEYRTYNNNVFRVSYYNDELILETEETTYTIAYDETENYTTKRTTKSIQWSDISGSPIYTYPQWRTILAETEWNGSDEIKTDEGWFSVGQTYSVTWDGSYYSVVCANDDMFEACLGNRSLRSKSDYNTDTGEPFCISISDGNFDIRTSVSGAHTIEIETMEDVPVPINEGYIPDTIQRVGDSVIINSSTEGSTKKFKITVSDDGTLTATEVTD